MNSNPRIYKPTLLYPELSYKVCGICFQVHNSLGRFRNEKQYTDAVEIALKNAGIIFIREKFLPPSFQGEGRNNIPDFVIEDKIVVDLKTKRVITKQDYFQMRRYLSSTNKQLGLLINFRPQFLTIKRILNTESAIR